MTFLRPYGFIDFDKLAGVDLLIAEREGSGGCGTSIKFKDNFKFSQRNVCFGVEEIRGTYKLKNDTIFFNNEKHLKFGLVKPSSYEKDLKSLYLFTEANDTTGFELEITKNDLVM
ncbi:hypothetical protein [Hymenobacter sp. DG25B]|uniref:hypothetical protein n=1 Tax=Hymenobacter sp. DG25B TaxID=1385664 RepID=UPI0018CC8A44|nr:hypothetical protein [Hymenobacter sp. DG25B]